MVFDDLIRGRVVVSNAELDDLIIRRTDGSPTYNLTVVVDDADMEITHVIRGDDHLNNTPRQINILKALGAEPPRYGHVPMILGDDGARLSKRHGAVSVMQYLHDGFLPEALLNYLVRLGWSHGDQEIFSVDEMIQLFELESVNRAPSAFNTDKLRWLNQHYIKTTDPLRVAHLLGHHLGTDGYRPRPKARTWSRWWRRSASAPAPWWSWPRSVPSSTGISTAIDEKAAKKAFKAGADEALRGGQGEARGIAGVDARGPARRGGGHGRRGSASVSARWRCRCASRSRAARRRRISI